MNSIPRIRKIGGAVPKGQYLFVPYMSAEGNINGQVGLVSSVDQEGSGYMQTFKSLGFPGEFSAGMAAYKNSYTPLHAMALKLLYNPRIASGMDTDQLRKIFSEIYPQVLSEYQNNK